jgi:hypothetical protein
MYGKSSDEKKSRNLGPPPLVGFSRTVPSSRTVFAWVGDKSRVRSVLVTPTMMTWGISPFRARKSTVPRVWVRWASPSVM